VGLFFGTVFGIYFIINAYMFARLYMTLAGFGAFRAVVCVLFLICSASFPIGRVFGHNFPAGLDDFLKLTGSLYIAPMIYACILTVATDIFRALNSVIAITHNPPPFSAGVRFCSVTTILALSVLITAAGIWNANTPVVVTHDVEWEAPDDAPGASLKIAVISDIHLGQFTGPSYIKKIADLLNEQQPDIVLLVGDMVDENSFFRNAPRVEETERMMASFKSRLGTWAVMGNHDYYTGAANVTEFLFRSNVALLGDKAAVPGGEIILVGRDDRTVERMGARRKSIEDIIAESIADSSIYGLPMIVMDHQPFALEEAERAGAALQVSGHTHRGQLFPVNFIVSMMYEKHYGLYKKGDTNYYITSGAGVWGPPVRTIGRPEIAILNLSHKTKGASGL
jgi:predicted MPP superfamily phosphohydrolase